MDGQEAHQCCVSVMTGGNHMWCPKDGSPVSGDGWSGAYCEKHKEVIEQHHRENPDAPKTQWKNTRKTA